MSDVPPGPVRNESRLVREIAGVIGPPDFESHATEAATNAAEAARAPKLRFINITPCKNAALADGHRVAERSRPRLAANEDIAENLAREGPLLGTFPLVVRAEIRKVRAGLIQEQLFVKIVGGLVFEVVKLSAGD